MGRKQNLTVDEEGRSPADRNVSRPDALTIVLVHPRIPPNTGNIARLCAATGTRLHLIRPLFRIDDAKLKRAGLDYWPLLDVRVFTDWAEWVDQHQDALNAGRCWLVEVGGQKLYTEVAYRPGDYLIFGDEEDGLSPELMAEHAEQTLRLPQQGVRSLNLSNAVAVVCYEALRQLDWPELH